MPATVSFLERATDLLPFENSKRIRLMPELAIAQRATGDTGRAEETLGATIELAKAAKDEGATLRARIEAAYLRLLSDPEGAAGELLELVEAAVPTFEALADDRALSRAWLLSGYVHGGLRGHHLAWERDEERALHHYRRTGFPLATCIGQIAAAVYWGPTVVPKAIERCAGLLTRRLGTLAARR